MSKKQPTTAVIIINGLPLSGKDTFVGFVKHAVTADGRIGFEELSSIQSVKDMLHDIGVNVTNKTDADRKLLSEIGDSLEAHSMYKTTKMIKAVNKFHNNTRMHGVYFLYIREPGMIKYAEGYFKNNPTITCETLVINSVRGKSNLTNSADSSVHKISYKHHVENNGSLGELARAADMFYREQILRMLGL